MKRSCLLLLLLACLGSDGCQGFASEYQQALTSALRHLGEPVPQRLAVKPTPALLKTALPKRVAVQKVVPRRFPDLVLSNLFARTGINPNQIFEGATGGVFGTPGVRYFGSLEKNHILAVIPAQGWMHYTCQDALNSRGDTTAVGPSEEETLRRGLEFARFLGLQESDLAKLPRTNRLDYRFSVTHHSSLKQPRHVAAREAFFRRAIDGYPVVTGHLYGGLWVGFGYGGKLYKFALTARATQPAELLSVAPLGEQLKMLSESKALHAFAWPADAGESKKLAALEVDLVEVVYFEDAPENPQKVIPPLLRWEGDLKTAAATNGVVFFTPIREQRQRWK